MKNVLLFLTLVNSLSAFAGFTNDPNCSLVDSKVVSMTNVQIPHMSETIRYDLVKQDLECESGKSSQYVLKAQSSRIRHMTYLSFATATPQGIEQRFDMIKLQPGVSNSTIFARKGDSLYNSIEEGKAVHLLVSEPAAFSQSLILRTK